MGFRLHVAKKYEVHYSNAGFFGNRFEEFGKLLELLNVPVYSGCDKIDTMSEFYIRADNVKMYLINGIRSLDINENKRCLLQLEMITGEPIPEKAIEAFTDCMEQLYEEADKGDEFIHFMFY